MKSILLSPIYLIQGLFSKISQKLKQPQHSSVLSLRGLVAPVVTGLVVFGIANFIKPLGIAEYGGTDIVVKVGVLGLLAFAGVAICQFLLPIVLKSFYNEHTWTVSKQIVQSILMLVLSSVLVFYYLGESGLGKVNLPIDALKFIGIMIIPIVLFTFIQESVLSSKFESSSTKIMDSVSASEVVVGDNPLKMLVFAGAGNQFSLIPNQLIYAKVGASESEFVFQNFFGVEKKILSITESVVIDEISAHPQFKKINQDYFVNVNAIKKVSGSARGYEIEIAKTEKELKVSRKFNNTIENL